MDFALLRDPTLRTRFYLNAFDLAAKTQQIFRNQDVGADAYRAAQAMFLLFPPERVGGRANLACTTAENLNCSWSYALPLILPGQYTVTATAIDFAGNTASTAITVQVV